ncbi:MAG: HAMP domain-containing histidine kinase [Verrucomicrobiales bacterium]|nr:HAMP domain-containing histidine kinase [Verrucomicrobiales bacterium]
MNPMGDPGRRTAWGVRGAWAAIGLTWVVLGWVVAWGAGQIRDQVRGQIIRRDGQILTAMARVPSTKEAGDVEDAEGSDASEEADEEPWADFMHVAGREGIVASWLFDPKGVVKSTIPLTAREGAIPEEARTFLAGGVPFSRYDAAVPLASVFFDPALIEKTGWSAAIPMVEVYVPLTSGTGADAGWVAGFLIDGTNVAEEFAQLDRHLKMQGVGVLGVAMAITGVTLGFVFRRLHRARALLERRTEDLVRANAELLDSARIAALGSVTAHLVHGLRNPVSGLQSFVASRGGDGGPDADEWREAQAATQRMQNLIHDVVNVIRERELDLGYDVPLTEVGASVVRRAQALAERRGVRVVMEGVPGRRLDNRASGILALMLGNLVENAVEATPFGGCVRLRWNAAADRTVCEVADEGPGLSPEAKARLFRPQSSSKEGGSGLGLAITRQMALALGGDVRLTESGAGGTVFRVELPWAEPGSEAAPRSARTGTGNEVSA